MSIEDIKQIKLEQHLNFSLEQIIQINLQLRIWN